MTDDDQPWIWEAKHYCATDYIATTTTLQSDEVTECPVAETTTQTNLHEQFQERQAAHRVETAGDYERIMRQLDALILDINDIKRKVRQWHHNT
jgi:hypothetical protein